MNKFLIARRFLKAHRSDRFLSSAAWAAILGLGFGVAALFVSLSVIDGFESVFKESMVRFNSHLVVTHAYDPKEPLFEPLPEEFKKEVIGWSPFIYQEGLLVAGDLLQGIVLKAVDFEKIQKLSHLTIQPVGSPSKKNPTVYLGKALWEKLGGRPQKIRLLFSENKGEIRTHTFEAVGFFQSGLHEYDSNFAFMEIDAAKRYFSAGSRVSGIEIWLGDPDRALDWVQPLRREFNYPYGILSWRDMNESIFRSLQTEKMIFSILMIFLTAIACFNLLAALVMLILNKRRSAAMLRVIGFSWSDLRKIFLFDGLLIGSAGLIFGFLLAGGALAILKIWHPIELAPEIYFINQVPVHVTWTNFLGVACVGFLLVLGSCWVTLKSLTRLPVLRSLVEA